MPPSVTIIMPCYNASTFLHASVGSVQAQTHTEWELVIVDDGSADDSWQVMQEIARTDPRVRVFQQSKSGASIARNRALQEARGALIAFLDADDTWHPEFLSSMLNALAAHPDAGIAYCGWQNLGLGKQRDEPFVPPEYENGDKIESLLGGCRWPIHGTLVRSQIIKDAGCFDETLSSCMDYDLWLRLGTVHRLVRVPRVLAFYHHHGGEQITRNRDRIALNHLRVQKKYLRCNPSVLSNLGRSRVRQLTCGRLLRSGYDCYWQRDIPAARQIFRAVMKHGYGTFKDWKYMLPAWLPESWHRWLIRQCDRRKHTAEGESM